MTFEPLAWGRHVEGVRAGKHQTFALPRVVKNQLLRDGAALGTLC